MRVYSLFHQVRIKQHKICSCFTNLLEESAAIPSKPKVGRAAYKSNVVPQQETHELTIAKNMTVWFTPVVDPPQPDEYIFTVMPNGNLLFRFSAHQHCSFRLVL